ncbi:unnamed protein product [Rotaria socialis]|uniref:Uncharacterized protein n=1 Tax=Rotaria socialis TaxID=392032 RepID=A0A818TY28_9BILA|nr:unnamed protein product [Rotaria socialis]CAF3690523.1 unnamed protein product [Rotaria socialis]
MAFSYGTQQYAATKDDMADAYELGSAMAREQLSAEDRHLLENIGDDAVIVVPGTYDHIHQVLTSLKIPFKTVHQEELLTYPLRPADQTVYVNCASSFPAAVAHRLRKFVDDGGQLITTDWALKNVLEVAFGEFVRHNGQMTGDEVVGIQVNDPTNPIVAGFLPAAKHVDPQWWLESSSYPIEIVDAQRVRVLIKSNELNQKYNAYAVLITFDCGKGNVIHMISHFYLQRSETRGERHKMSSEQFAMDMNVSDGIKAKAKQMSHLNYAQAQSSATSSAFIYNQLAELFSQSTIERMDYVATTSFRAPEFKRIDAPWIGLLILGIIIFLSSIISIAIVFLLWRYFRLRAQLTNQTQTHTLTTNTATGKRPIPVQIEEEQPPTIYETQKMEVFVPTNTDERSHGRYPVRDDIEQVRRFYERTTKAYF